MMDRPSRLHALLATPLLFVAMSSALGATTYTVTAMGDGYYYQPVFSPSTLQIHAGDTVTFHNLGAGTGGGMHNVHADDDSFQCAVSCSGPNNTPNDAAWREFRQSCPEQWSGQLVLGYGSPHSTAQRRVSGSAQP